MTIHVGKNIWIGCGTSSGVGNWMTIGGGLSIFNGNKFKSFDLSKFTGLNCILTFIESLKLNIFLNYTSLEPYPLEMKIIDNLNFNLDSKQLDVFKLIHQSFWGKAVEINKQFSLEKYKLELKDFNTNKFYDIIYFDAFAPNKQPELWKVDVFSKLFNLTSNNGVLVTYCAKGQVRRDLEKVGYFVERLEGPPGKREMLRATKV